MTTVFATDSPVLFSKLTEKRMGLKLTWKSWSPKMLELQSTCILLVRKPGSDAVQYRFDLSTVLVTHMEHRAEDHEPDTTNISSSNPMAQKQQQSQQKEKETGVFMQVHDTDGHETQIRIIVQEDLQSRFYAALRAHCRQHNLDNIRMMSITEHVLSSRHKAQKSSSAMRSAVASAMDSFDKSQRKQHIIDKRGAFEWLPVYFANDLVHGSW
jgi:hypothetical protein